MKKATSLEEEKQLTFDCYCKRVLKHEAIDIQRNNQYMNSVQTSFSELSQEQLGTLCTCLLYTSIGHCPVAGTDCKCQLRNIQEFHGNRPAHHT